MMHLFRSGRLSLTALAFSGLLSACNYDNAEDLLGNSPPIPACDPAAITYAAHVAPLLQQQCLSCHNDAFRSGNISLQGYTQARAVAVSGLLLGTVSHAAGYQPMPQGGPKLSDCEIERIRGWVAAGTPNN